MSGEFAVFLSHNSSDKPAVRRLAEALRKRGLRVWLDEWELVPGRSWLDALEEIIATTRAAAVLVGKDGLGPWEAREMRACLLQFVKRELPVIPVLLPGAPADAELPMFLDELTWVDLRQGITEEGLDRLVWGITGEKPKPTGAGTRVAEQPRRHEPEEEVAGRRPARRRTVPLLGAIGIALVVVVVLVWHYFPTSAPPPSAPPPPRDCPYEEQDGEYGMVMVRICGGTFTMGSAEDDLLADDDEKPAHQVTVSEFWIGKTEVTNEQYREVHPDHRPNEDGELPATWVSWHDAKDFCERAGYRLPTEAEWEYAARAGTQTPWSFGANEEDIGDFAWYADNSGREARPVGTQGPNPWGLHDMHGNVWEWVADAYGRYSAEPQTDPELEAETPGGLRGVRGGGYWRESGGLRSASRFWVESEFRNPSLGFRCVRRPRRQP